MDVAEPYVYAGAGTGGLFRKSPAVEGWEEITNGLPPSPEVRVITTHPLSPNPPKDGLGDSP